MLSTEVIILHASLKAMCKKLKIQNTGLLKCNLKSCLLKQLLEPKAHIKIIIICKSCPQAYLKLSFPKLRWFCESGKKV